MIRRLNETIDDSMDYDLNDVNADLAMIEKYAKSIYDNAVLLNRKLADTTSRSYALDSFLDVNADEIADIRFDITDLEERLRLMGIDLERIKIAQNF
jgi:hypothetical protein